MTTAIFIITTISFILIAFVAYSVYHMIQSTMAIVLGLNESLETGKDLYLDNKYTIASLKVLLDNAEHINIKRMEKAIAEENIEDAQYYKELCETIVKLKTLSVDEIESGTQI